MNSQISDAADWGDSWILQWVGVAERAAHGGFWNWDVKRGSVYCSEVCRSMYGFSAKALVDAAEWSRRVHPDDRLKMSALAVGVQDRHDTEFRNEFRFTGPEGETRWVCSHGEVCYDPNGQPETMVGFDIDITPQKRADEALERSERLVTAGRIVATVAHEINNPLEAVTNLVYLAKADDSLDQIRAYLEQAECELARAQAISRQTLSFYREETEGQVFELGDLLESCLNLLGPRLKRRNATISIHHKDPAPLYAKRGEILQVLLNLLSNSIEAMGSGGHLQIHAKRRGEHLRIAVSDNGSGIAVGHRKHLFTPFFTTKGKEGTGLGLWVSRAIIHRHRGTIRFRSSTVPGRSGTLFIIHLPSGLSQAAA